MHSLHGSFVTKPSFIYRLPAGLVFLSLIIALSGCATSRFSAGDQKNSLPLAEKRLLGEVHTVAVAPFYHDDHHWRQLAQEALAAPRLDVIPQARVDAAERSMGKDLSGIGSDSRVGALVRLGRSLQADAVLNGVVLSKGDNNELIIQLISSGDSRILFWQAVDFSFQGERLDPEVQRELIARMLGPLVANLAKHKKALPAQAQPKTEEAPTVVPGQEPAEEKSKSLPRTGKKRKSDRRHEQAPKPAVVPEDISPM